MGDWAREERGPRSPYILDGTFHGWCLTRSCSILRLTDPFRVVQGGGNVLGFVTRTTGPPSPDTVKLLSGVIVSSPLLVLSMPVPSFQRWLARKARPLLPNLQVPTPTKEEVGGTLTFIKTSSLTRGPVSQDLNRHPERNKVLSDPLIRQMGTVAGLTDMFDGVSGVTLCGCALSNSLSSFRVRSWLIRTMFTSLNLFLCVPESHRSIWSGMLINDFAAYNPPR